MNGFTQLIDLSTTLSDVAGYTHRYHPAYLGALMNSYSSDCGCYPSNHQICVCLCEIRIGELREAMDDILHKQCDYDPASGESFDFDRSEQ